MIEWILIGLAFAAVLQLLMHFLLLLRLGRRVKAIERVNERLTHFADALTLLTDTTESGLSSVANGLTALGQRAATRTAVRSTARRIARAAQDGVPLAAIAAGESMSESEIRLHLQLSRDTEKRHAALRV